MRVDPKLVTAAGEHFVCAALAQLEWAPSLTREGLTRTDILAVHTRSREMIEVQVKAMREVRRPAWPLGRKGLVGDESGREWYVFVLLPADVTRRPRCWVLPRDHVSAATWIAHESWRTSPGVPPGKRNAGVESARVAQDNLVRYEERWDLLGQPTCDVPVLLPEWMRAQISNVDVGLPDGHRWHLGIPSWLPDGEQLPIGWRKTGRSPQPH